MIQIASTVARTSVLLNKGVHMNWSLKLSSFLRHNFPVINISESFPGINGGGSSFSGSINEYKNKVILNNDKECAFYVVFSNRDISGQLFHWDTQTANPAMLVIEAECFQTADELYDAHTLIFLNRKHCLAVIVNFGTLLAAVWWNKNALFNLPKVA